MYIRSGHSTNVALALTCDNTTPRGYVYADSSSTIGFLNHKIDTWRLRIFENENYIYGNVKSPNMYFYEGGAKTWTGNAGTNRGKIEYHSNRFYLNAGSNSVRIVNFRRGGSDKSYIDNNGTFVGPVNATSLKVNGATPFVDWDAFSLVSYHQSLSYRCTSPWNIYDSLCKFPKWWSKEWWLAPRHYAIHG